MTRSVWGIPFVLALGCGVVPVRAQPPPPIIRLSLDEAQAAAVAQSHRLAEARARGMAADAAAERGAAAGRPQVALSAGYTRTNHVPEVSVSGPAGGARVLYPDVPNNYRTRIDLQWPIYTAGRLEALERSARADADAAGAETAAAVSDLRLEVARTFWALVTARASAAVLERAGQRAEAHLRDARERFNAGLVPPNEVAAAEAQHSRQRMLRIEAQNQLQLSSSELARLAAVDANSAIEPVETLERPGNSPDSVAPLVLSAQATRHDRRALQLRVGAAEEQQTAARASAMPSVSLAAGADYAKPNPRIFPRADRWDDAWDIGVNVSWSVLDGGRNRAERAQANALATVARERLAEFDTVLELEIRQRLLEGNSARAAVAAAGDAVRAAAEAHRVVTERYRAGVSTQTEILDAEIMLLQAELDQTRAMANLRLAEARLTRAVGR